MRITLTMVVITILIVLAACLFLFYRKRIFEGFQDEEQPVEQQGGEEYTQSVGNEEVAQGTSGEGVGNEEVAQGPSGEGVGSEEVAQGPSSEEYTQGVGNEESAQGPSGEEYTQGVGNEEVAQGPSGEEYTQGVGSEESAQGPSGEEYSQGVGSEESAQGQSGEEYSQGVGSEESAQGPSGEEYSQGVGSANEESSIGMEESELGGPIPRINEESSIPGDVSGATRSNPSVALASPKDIQALADSFQKFKTLLALKDASATNLSSEKIKQIQYLQNNIAVYDNKIKAAYTNPEIAGMTLKEVRNLRMKLDKLTRELNNSKIVRGPVKTLPAQNMGLMDEQVAYIGELSQPTLVAAPTQQVSLKDIINLRDRINRESTNISNTRTTSPTILARQNQLDDLAGNLTNMISSIQRGTMSINDVPFSKEEATNFLQALDMKQQFLPSLNIQGGTSSTKAEQFAPSYDSVFNSPTVKDLLNTTQYLKWGVQINVSYDPADRIMDNYVTKLDSIEDKLTKLAIKNKPIDTNEVVRIQSQLRDVQKFMNHQKQKQTTKPKRFPETQCSRNGNNMYRSQPEMPYLENLERAQSSGFPRGENSNDVYIRPGFAMNDEQIARRGSSSAFDPKSVGGPDYKKRALELCRQIGAANLGDTTNFGCINNPDEVGPYYSWKGNYKMVCNRLGDTWGSWYPDMFGCPKQNPQQRFKGAN